MEEGVMEEGVMEEGVVEEGVCQESWQRLPNSSRDHLHGTPQRTPSPHSYPSPALRLLGTSATV
jgi:hypothetical protein